MQLETASRRPTKTSPHFKRTASPVRATHRFALVSFAALRIRAGNLASDLIPDREIAPPVSVSATSTPCKSTVPDGGEVVAGDGLCFVDQLSAPPMMRLRFSSAKLLRSS